MANQYYDRYQQQQNHQNGSGQTDFRNMDLASALTYVKGMYQDPNAAIQQMLASGQASQQEYDAAVQKYQQMRQLFNK